jgi:hypothetical protein
VFLVIANSTPTVTVPKKYIKTDAHAHLFILVAMMTAPKIVAEYIYKWVGYKTGNTPGFIASL